MSPILGNFVGSIFTPLGGTPVCSGKNGITPSGISILNLLGPGSGGGGVTGCGSVNVGISGTIGVTGVTGAGGINGVNPDLSSSILSTAAFTIAKPTGITNKLGNVTDRSRIKPILHLFLLL